MFLSYWILHTVWLLAWQVQPTDLKQPGLPFLHWLIPWIAEKMILSWHWLSLTLLAALSIIGQRIIPRSEVMLLIRYSMPMDLLAQTGNLDCIMRVRFWTARIAMLLMWFSWQMVNQTEEERRLLPTLVHQQQSVMRLLKRRQLQPPPILHYMVFSAEVLPDIITWITWLTTPVV